MEKTATTTTHALPDGFDPGCACGDGRLSELSWGWVIHPAEYAPGDIGPLDASADCALRRVSENDAQAILSGELTSL